MYVRHPTSGHDEWQRCEEMKQVLASKPAATKSKPAAAVNLGTVDID
jgi:hypothetical protein